MRLMMVIVIFWAIMALIPLFIEHDRQNSIEDGSIWEYCANVDNPYKPKKCYTSKVIESKDGYVKYIILESDWSSHDIGNIESDSIYLYKVSSKKLN